MWLLQKLNRTGTWTVCNVEAREAILEYERQLAEKEERQKREIANIQARENAEISKINEEERLKAESVRIRTEEELAIAEENKERQVIILWVWEFIFQPQFCSGPLRS